MRSWRVTSRPSSPRQAEIEHHEVRASRAGRRERGRAVGRREYGEAGVLEVVAGELDDARLVVDDEDGLLAWSSVASYAGGGRVAADA